MQAVRIGNLIAGRYRVEGELGRGGMGVVVAATHVDLDQRVAIKMLHPEAAEEPSFAARFSREARAAARIRSEHVARVMDFGTLDDGAAYIVMEHLEGQDLAGVLARRGALPIPLAVDYVLQACEALAAAHAVGIVHRDVKPANIFLAKQADRTDIIKVLDFGVSKLAPSAAPAEGEPIVTHTGQVFGSPMYMAPEQLRGSGQVDARADVWALGAVLYELLTQKPPFWRRSFADVTASILRDPAPLLRDALPAAPEGLERVIARCLAKEPGDRYADVGALARDLLPFGPRGAADRVEKIERLLGAFDVTAPIEGSGDASSGVREVSANTPREPTPPAVAPSTPGSHESASQPSLAAEAPARRSDGVQTRRRAVIAIGALLFVGLVGARLLRPAPQRVAAIAPPVTASAVIAPPVLTTSVVVSSAPTASASAPESPEVTITIDATPPETKVLLDDAVIATEPGPLRLPRGSKKLTLRFVATGYTPSEVELVPDADRLLSVRLTRAPANTQPVRTRTPKDLEPF